MVLTINKTIDWLRSQLVGIRDSINESLISTIMIKYNGQSSSLEQISMVSQKNRKISIVPFDISIIKTIEVELNKLGFDSYRFSKNTIVINIPPDSLENQKKIMRQIKALTEKAKIAIRSIRKSYRKKYKEKTDQNKIDKITKEKIKEIDRMIF